MTEAQEKILLETHGLAKQTFGSLEALIEDVRNNRDNITENQREIRRVEGVMVTKVDCAEVQTMTTKQESEEEERKKWAWNKGSRFVLIILSLFNFLLGSGLIAKILGVI